MPSFADSVFLFFLALILFGPKRLPELARQLGKLMGEFRRASNEFKYQMEEELRQTEQAEERKKLEEQAKTEDPDAPKPIATEGELSIMPPSTGLPTAAGTETEAEATTPALSAEQREAAALDSMVASIPNEFPDEHMTEPIHQPAEKPAESVEVTKEFHG